MAHRISAILVHTGVKSSDLTRLNCLGICMSHRDSETIKKQAEMGQAHNKKVLTWKHEVENKAQAKELLSEIFEKQ